MAWLITISNWTRCKRFNFKNLKKETKDYNQLIKDISLKKYILRFKRRSVWYFKKEDDIDQWEAIYKGLRKWQRFLYIWWIWEVRRNYVIATNFFERHFRVTQSNKYVDYFVHGQTVYYNQSSLANEKHHA